MLEAFEAMKPKIRFFMSTPSRSWNAEIVSTLLKPFLLLTMLSSAAFADPTYSRSELESMSHAELVEIILRLQGGAFPQNCKTYKPLTGETGTILTRLNNQYANNDGTLKYPDGTTFMLRNLYANNDRTLYFPNGQVMLLQNLYANNDHTTYWPNGVVQRLRNLYANNDGNISRADGSVWLRRNLYSNDDHQRIGLPVENYRGSNFEVRAHLTSDDSVLSKTIMRGNGWSLEITLNGSDDSVLVKECYE